MGVGGPCGVCGTAARLSCGGCGTVHYCGKQHQRQHWPQHRPQCLPYRITSSPNQGRYLVTARRLDAGQTVLEESPLAVGPRARSNLLCLGCHAPVTQSDFVRCPQCWWPLCSPECSSSSLHQPECPILAADTKHIGAPHEQKETPRYDVILLLRCLLLRDTNPASWKVLLEMAHHSELRQIREEAEQLVSVRYVMDELKVNFEESVVHQVKGAISTNVVEILMENKSLRAMYPKVRIMNNSCSPNVHLICKPGWVMECRTSVSVPANQPLCICYTCPTLPLWERQTDLKANYHFLCECIRCTDSTELNTYFSSPRCPKCVKGQYLEPHNVAGELAWLCPKCKTGKSNWKVREEVEVWLKRIQSDAINSCNSMAQVRDLLDQVEDEFHAQHFVWMRVAHMSLNKLQGEVSWEGLHLRSDLCHRLANLYGVLEPGMTRRRGVLLLEAGMLLLQALRENGSESERQAGLNTVLQDLRQAFDILSIEPPNTKLRKQATRAQDGLREAEKLQRDLEGSMAANDIGPR